MALEVRMFKYICFRFSCPLVKLVALALYKNLTWPPLTCYVRNTAISRMIQLISLFLSWRACKSFQVNLITRRFMNFSYASQLTTWFLWAALCRRAFLPTHIIFLDAFSLLPLNPLTFNHTENLLICLWNVCPTCRYKPIQPSLGFNVCDSSCQGILRL